MLEEKTKIISVFFASAASDEYSPHAKDPQDVLHDPAVSDRFSIPFATPAAAAGSRGADELYPAAAAEFWCHRRFRQGGHTGASRSRGETCSTSVGVTTVGSSAGGAGCESWRSRWHRVERYEAPKAVQLHQEPVPQVVLRLFRERRVLPHVQLHELLQ